MNLEMTNNMKTIVPDFLQQRGITNIVALDFETYFDTHYTLKKMSTSLYIYDAKFHAYGAGIDDVFINHKYLPMYLQRIDWKHTALLCHHTQFDGLILHHHYGITPAYYLDTMSMARPFYKNTIGVSLDAVAKELGYEGKISNILSRIKGKHDLTQDEYNEMMEYCIQDVASTIQVYNDLIPRFTEQELDLIDMTIRMFATPKFGCDIDRIDKEINNQITQRNHKILATSLVISGANAQTLELYEKENRHEEAKAFLRMIGVNDKYSYDKIVKETEKILNSPLKFAEALQNAGTAPPTKISKTTGKITYAFAAADIEFQKLANHPKAAVRKLYQGRLASKSTTALDKALKLRELAQYGFIPAYLNYWKAQTGRWTGGDKIQLQNMPRGGEMRKSLTAGNIDSYLCVIDSSGIEMRVLAWLSENERILQFIREGKDVYKIKASEIYGIRVEEVSKDQRFVGKVVMLGLGYGMSGNKFQITLEAGMMGPPLIISKPEAQLIVDKFREQEFKVTELWKRADKWLTIMMKGSNKEPVTYKGITFREEHIDLPDGTTLYYPDLKGRAIWYDDEEPTYTEFNYQENDKNKRKYIYGGLLVENIVQALSRSIVAEQTLKASKHYPCLLMVHDEGVFKIPKFKYWQHEHIIAKYYTTPPIWASDLPINAEWGSAYEYSK